MQFWKCTMLEVRVVEISLYHACIILYYDIVIIQCTCCLTRSCGQSCWTPQLHIGKLNIEWELSQVTSCMYFFITCSWVIHALTPCLLVIMCLYSIVPRPPLWIYMFCAVLRYVYNWDKHCSCVLHIIILYTYAWNTSGAPEVQFYILDNYYTSVQLTFTLSQFN